MSERSSEDLAIPSPDGEINTIDTDYKVGQDNIRKNFGPLCFDIHNPVFLISSLTILAFVFVTLVFQDQAESVFNIIFNFVTTTFDWLFLSAANFFVIFCIFLIFSPLGKVRLGGTEATPDFSYLSWFAMLFAAGMGIGLMFFSVLEPVYHMQVSGPLGLEGPIDTQSGSVNAAQLADARGHGLAATIFHFGLHPWAVYAVVALSLSLFTYNKQLPLSIRSAFYPLMGNRVWGWPGHLIDIIAVFATLFGLTTSLGLGAKQASSGMHYVFGIPDGLNTQITVIACVTAVALVSVIRGIHGGVRVLSNLNMCLAVLLLFFVFFAGPTVQILKDVWNSVATYAADIVPLSNPVGREDDSFRESWTSFYWAWWISWSPFVGMFIARVSRGRTVREFLTCAILIPTAVSLIWMATFGGTAIHHVATMGAESGVYQNVIANYNDSLAMFAMFGDMPLTMVTSTIAIVLVLVFFITSSDSGSLVIDTITAGGKTEAPKGQRIFWATTEGVVAIVLLIGGGLTALQAMVNATGIIFTLILLFLCWAIYTGLKSEPRA
jgi:BCCT family betaine/carnitine transporter